MYYQHIVRQLSKMNTDVSFGIMTKPEIISVNHRNNNTILPSRLTVSFRSMECMVVTLIKMEGSASSLTGEAHL